MSKSISLSEHLRGAQLRQRVIVIGYWVVGVALTFLLSAVLVVLPATTWDKSALREATVTVASAELTVTDVRGGRETGAEISLNLDDGETLNITCLRVERMRELERALVPGSRLRVLVNDANVACEAHMETDNNQSSQLYAFAEWTDRETVTMVIVGGCGLVALLMIPMPFVARHVARQDAAAAETIRARESDPPAEV